MNIKKFGVVLLLSLLGFTMITIPATVTAHEWQKEGYPVYVSAKGNMTLTNDISFNITNLQANFTAMAPTQLTYGDYNASFHGEAKVSNETIKFRGILEVNGIEFYVSFTVPNVEVPVSAEEEKEGYDASGELEITISQISVVPKEKAWIMIKGPVISYGGQRAFGWLNSYAKLGEWARVRAFFMPGSWTWDNGSFYKGNANITVEGNLTLTFMLKSYDIAINVNFTAKVPEEIESGNYTASFEGSAYVTEEIVQFTGYLTVDDIDFSVMFTIPNTYPDLPKGPCTVSGELTVLIPNLPATHFEFTLYVVRLVNASVVALNYSSNDFYISGLWDVYNITWTYFGEHNFTMTVKPAVVNETGEFNVTNFWKEFTLDITGLELISGKVSFLCYRSFVVPLGDVNGDYVVDIFDLVHVAKRYRTTPGMTEFDFDLDFNDNFEIDIYDLTTIGANLGENY